MRWSRSASAWSRWRADVLRQLAEADHVDAGRLALLADVGGALAVLDALVEGRHDRA
jgi:hypothetical protein